MSEQRNLLLAIVISGLIIGLYHVFFSPRAAQVDVSQKIAEKEIEIEDLAMVLEMERKTKVETPAKHKIEIRTAELSGHINLKGGRIDELELNKYPETTDKDSPFVKLIRPKGSPNEYFADFGFLGVTSSTEVPNFQTVWKLEKNSKVLSENRGVNMNWQNKNGLKFRRQISLIQPYLFSIKDTVVNESPEAVKLVPYGRVFRRLQNQVEDFFVFHEGFMENLDGAVEQIDYSDLDSSQVKEVPQNAKSWISNTDKYWMTLLYPLSQAKLLRFSAVTPEKAYQGDYQLEALNLEKGNKATSEHLFFAGPKIEEILNQYQEEYGIENISYAIDWGWFSPLTKFVSWLLIHMNDFIHNVGVSIVVLTVMMRTVMFPLVVKSTKNARKMKLLSPELKRIRKLYGSSRETMATQISKLYKKHDVSIMSMILPMLVQIPIFFSVYKVLLISIEMRHTPFLYWITDLSAKDPTNIFNLFGLVSWSPPDFLHVGIWPILVGLSFYLQQKFGQATPMHDTSSTIGEALSKTMKILPFIMTFILASFPAGLMIFWFITNLLGIVQHQTIDRWILPKKTERK